MPDLCPQRAVGTPKPASVDTRIACHLIGQDQVRHGDAVIETPDGRVIGVEVKAGATNNKPGKQNPEMQTPQIRLRCPDKSHHTHPRRSASRPDGRARAATIRAELHGPAYRPKPQGRSAAGLLSPTGQPGWSRQRA